MILMIIILTSWKLPEKDGGCPICWYIRYILIGSMPIIAGQKALPVELEFIIIYPIE